MIISSTSAAPAADGQIAAAVADVLARRAAMLYSPTTLAISDSVALGIAAQFSSSTPSGRVLEALYRTGTADSDELVAAARTEQGFASPEGHAALYCFIGWVRSRVERRYVYAG